MSRGPSGAGEGLTYGALGLPLAFAALPLYVQLPAHYAERFGMPLAVLGVLLLLVRAADALVDPWLGRWIDGRFALGLAAVHRVLLMAAALLGLGVLAVYLPPVREPGPLLLWCGASLVLTYLAYSTLSVLHQSWCARLGGGDAGQARWIAWREGAALLGVVVASVLPSLLGMERSLLVFVLLLAGAAALFLRARPPAPRPTLQQQAAPGETPRPAVAGAWRSSGLRRLLVVFMLNGVAAAVPATLVLFFVRDRLQLPAWEGAFLAAYFVSAALVLPLWVRVVARIGLLRTWALGMGLAVLAFAATVWLGAGQGLAFLLVCVLSGAALGADLVVPGALLARVVVHDGVSGSAEGAYFGWWSGATKLNLALAAGLSLPLLGWAGYVPGSRDAAALTVLAVAYGLLPCALKLLALLALWGLLGRDAPAFRGED